MQQWPQLLLHEALPPPAPLGAPPSRVRVAELIFPCCSQMDKKYNENWIVVIGQGFAFEVTHEVKHVLWMCASPVVRRPPRTRPGPSPAWPRRATTLPPRFRHSPPRRTALAAALPLLSAHMRGASRPCVSPALVRSSCPVRLRRRYFCDIAVLVCKAGARQVGT